MNWKIESILEETTKLVFPFLASEGQKRKIIIEEKRKIDEEINEFLFSNPDKLLLTDAMRESFWQHAKELAGADFSDLPKKLRLNGFYFQQLMYNYVDLIKQYFERINNE